MQLMAALWQPPFLCISERMISMYIAKGVPKLLGPRFAERKGKRQTLPWHAGNLYGHDKLLYCIQSFGTPNWSCTETSCQARVGLWCTRKIGDLLH